MTRDHVQIVDFPYPDDWWDDEKMLAPMDNMSDIMLQRDHKHDLAFCPLETALEKGVESFGFLPDTFLPARKLHTPARRKSILHKLTVASVARHSD